MTSPDTATITRSARLSGVPVEAMSALLEVDVPAAEGFPLPPLWHWMHLLPTPKQSELGPDGHPTTGIPKPPGEGRRRMFAGGRVTTLAPLIIGEETTRTTRIVKTVEKEGRTGPLTFVTVEHELSQGGEVRIREQQDVVYRAAEGGSLPPRKDPAPELPSPRLELAVDEAFLFRFSALTYNAHRIHYDHHWAAHEGYEDLVVHGPLQALLMAELMRRDGVDLVGRTFEYRLVAPMIGPQTFTVGPAEEGLEAGARSRSAAGTITAIASLTDAQTSS